MTKRLPTDALIMLHNRLAALKPRDPIRRTIIAEAAQFYDVSTAKLYRELRQHNKPKSAYRSDYNQPRLASFDQMRQYCELIAALKLRTTNKKGRHLSTQECIRLLENHGIETPSGLVKAPPKFLKKSTVSIYLKRFGLDKTSLAIQPTVVHFQAEQSNACWHFDFSPSDFKHFPDDQKKSRTEHPPTLMIASVVDDRSGAMYQEYHYVYGEDVMTALKFLFNAMAPKKIPNFSFQGIPGMLYLDNGPVAKSSLFHRVMAHLGVELKTHMPDGRDGRRKTARAKGKVERPFRTTKETLEPLYHLRPPRNVIEANTWLRQYLQQRYNQEKHRYENHSRFEDWKLHLPSEGFRAMCDWDRFAALCREPESRKVGSDACVTISNVPYQLSNELAGLTVTLLWGLFDNELHVEHDGQQYGPYYPAKGPIPLGQYRPFKKSSREKRADYIGDLAKKIALPHTVLGTQDQTMKELLAVAGLAEEKLSSVPFNSQEIHDSLFKDAIEAKAAIARWLGFPLSRLQPEQLAEINTIVAATLEKQTVMSRVKHLFELRLINPQQEKR